MTEARVEPLGPPYAAAVADALARIMPPGRDPLVLFRTLAVNERVFLRVMAGGFLDRGSITLREREIVIDRTCARCGSEYEWGVHVALFRERARLTPEAIAATCDPGADASAFAPREQLLLRLVDELHDTSAVSDGLWRALCAEWSEAQLIELVAIAGFYHMISFLTNALRLPLEPYGARFPSRAEPVPSSAERV